MYVGKSPSGVRQSDNTSTPTKQSRDQQAQQSSESDSDESSSDSETDSSDDSDDSADGAPTSSTKVSYTVSVIGSGDMGQLGLGADTYEALNLTVVDPQRISDVKQVKAGGLSTICLTRAGEVVTRE
jgi:U3 small nucleolar RNA-associated protein 14